MTRWTNRGMRRGEFNPERLQVSSTGGRFRFNGSGVRRGALAKKFPHELGIWNAMLFRCYKPTAANYRDYGGRGIRVCMEWRHSFAAFMRDLGPRPSPRHSLDRIDVDGHYEPGNVRWALPAVQAHNQRPRPKVGPVRVSGVEMTPLEWSILLRLDRPRMNGQVFRVGTAPEVEMRKLLEARWAAEDRGLTA